MAPGDPRRDDAGAAQPATTPEDDSIAFGRKVGLGCFTFIIGGFSGGMVAVLIGRMVEGLKKAPSCDGLPSCNWYVYAGIGALAGALSLPALVLNRLRRR